MNGQNNGKFKIQHKCIKADTSATWQHRLHIPPTKVLSSQLLGKKQKQEPHKRAYLSENGGLGEKEARRMGQRQKRIRQKERKD